MSPKLALAAAASYARYRVRVNCVAPGLWFAAMNYAVHSIMYTYYFAMAARLTWLAVPVAPLITTTQILQMAVGSYVTFASASVHWHRGEAACHVNPANYKLGLAMYGSYFVLFCGLFLNKYFPHGGATAANGGRRPERGGKGDGEREQLCGIDLRKCDTAGRFAKSVRGFSPPAAEKLTTYAWPGNVRELGNAIERAVALTRFADITVEDLPEKIRNYHSRQVVISGSDPTDLVPMEEVERRYILHVLEACGGNRTLASQALHLDRKTLYRKLKSYGVNDSQ